MAVEVGPCKGARKRSFRMALRLAGRDARKHPGRSALIVSLIALPVAAMTMIVLLLASMQPTVQERIDAELGGAQAYLTTMHAQNSTTAQDPTQPRGSIVVGEPDPAFVPSDPADVVPEGYTVIEERSAQTYLSKGKLDISAWVVGSDLFNPAFESRFSLVEGTRTSNDDGVYLSPSLQERLGIEIGDSISTESGTYPVAGVIWEGGTVSRLDTVYVPVAHPMLGHDEEEYVQERIYLIGDEPLTWPQVKELNTQGVAALSKAVLLDPPQLAELPGATANQERQLITGVLGVSVVGILALAEVGLLAGAAFAVGAKNQRRMLALLSAAGGEKSTLRAVVTASGVVLGAIGAFAGVVVGVGITAAVVYWQLARFAPTFAGFHMLYWPLALFALLGFTASIIAAAVPGHAVSRQDAFSSLKSAQSASRPARRIPVVGLVLVVLALLVGGSGVAVLLGLDHPEQYGQQAVLFVPLLAGGTLLFLLGLLLCTGRIVDLLGSAAARLPAAARMAVRDASRNRSRSVPSIAAVLAATALAAIVMVSSATLVQEEAGKRPVNLNAEQGSVSLLRSENDGKALPSAEPAAVVAAVESVLGPVEWSTVIQGVHDACAPDQACTSREFVLPPENTCMARAERNEDDIWSCTDPVNNGGNVYPLLTVGGADTLTAMLGHAPERGTLQALEDGKMVVLDPAWIADGQVGVVSRTYEPGTGKEVDVSRLELAAVAAEPDERLFAGGVISAQTAKELGFTVTAQSVVMELGTQPTQADADAINLELESESWFDFQYPGPPIEKILWLIAGIAALVALTAAAITAGLALADGRADQMTLAGLGADPRLRKAMAATQAILTAGVGVGLGLVAGLLPAMALFGSAREYILVVPWLQLVALLVLVPVIGAGSAWLLTRARLPMTRRALLQ